MPTNSTDYDLPDMWGQMTDQQKSDWFTRERVFRQACRQDTAFGRRYRAHQEEQQRLDTDEFRVDDELE
jgi:hypothetical protein